MRDPVGPRTRYSSGSCGREGIVEDDRGVIMVVGVLFTFLWIGLCWFLFGVGNAIAYRENLQNAADAGAFAAAVYDARGMNIIAMINIEMGIALAMLISAKVIQLTTFATNSLECQALDAACGDPFCIPFVIAGCEALCQPVDDSRKKMAEVDKSVREVLKVSHYLETGLAVGWPWVAAGKSTAAGTYYGTTVPLVTSFSYSQIPYPAAPNQNALTNNLVNYVPGADADTGNTQTRYGLPVASDQYSNLCKAAFLDAKALGGLNHGLIPAAITFALGDAGEWFCDAGADANFASELIEFPVVGIGYVGFPIWPGLPNSCAVDRGMDTELPMSGSGDISDGNVTYSPMKLAPQARLGLDYYGVWSTAIGSFVDNGTKRVQIAGQQANANAGSKVVAVLPTDVYLGVTRAEFYYDPLPSEVGEGPGAEGNEMSISVKNTIYNMRWRARLRRYHSFPSILGEGDPSIGAVTSLMNENLTAVMSPAAGAALANSQQSTNDVVSAAFGTQDTNVNVPNNPPALKIFH